MFFLFFFFFQAEDGIRDYKVTGVQTCALPISSSRTTGSGGRSSGCPSPPSRAPWTACAATWGSEERRVGKSVDLGGRRIIKKKKTQKTKKIRHTPKLKRNQKDTMI